MIKHWLSSAILVLGATLAQASELPAYPFVHTGGTAYAFVVPDRGDIDFVLKVSDADPVAAQTLFDERVSALRTLTDQAGPDAVKLEIRDVRRNLRDENKSEATPPLHELTSAVQMEVKNLAVWATLLQPLLSMQNVSQLSTSFSTSERDKVEAQLTIDALKDARRRADLMARGVGKTVLGATAVSSGSLKNLTGAIGLQTYNSSTNTDPAARNTPGGSDPLMLVAMRMTQSVDVIFRLK